MARLARSRRGRPRPSPRSRGRRRARRRARGRRWRSARRGGPATGCAGPAGAGRPGRQGRPRKRCGRCVRLLVRERERATEHEGEADAGAEHAAGQAQERGGIPKHRSRIRGRRPGRRGAASARPRDACRQGRSRPAPSRASSGPRRAVLRRVEVRQVGKVHVRKFAHEARPGDALAHGGGIDGWRVDGEHGGARDADVAGACPLPHKVRGGKRARRISIPLRPRPRTQGQPAWDALAWPSGKIRGSYWTCRQAPF